jgi:hypothetical protein
MSANARKSALTANRKNPQRKSAVYVSVSVSVGDAHRNAALERVDKLVSIQRAAEAAHTRHSRPCSDPMTRFVTRTSNKPEPDSRKLTAETAPQRVAALRADGLSSQRTVIGTRRTFGNDGERLRAPFPEGIEEHPRTMRSPKSHSG